MDFTEIAKFITAVVGAVLAIVTVLSKMLRKIRRTLTEYIANQLSYTNKKVLEVKDDVRRLHDAVDALRVEMLRLADHQTGTKISVGEGFNEVRSDIKAGTEQTARMVAMINKLREDFGKVRWEK